MAEYVDRKPIIDKLKRTSTNATNTFINTVLIGLLNDEPTVDVVPRADIAMEIFEELHKEIFAALESNYKAKAERMARPNVDMADEFISYCEGKIAALRGIDDLITELKNNYIKE